MMRHPVGAEAPRKARGAERRNIDGTTQLNQFFCGLVPNAINVRVKLVLGAIGKRDKYRERFEGAMAIWLCTTSDVKVALDLGEVWRSADSTETADQKCAFVCLKTRALVF